MNFYLALFCVNFGFKRNKSLQLSVYICGLHNASSGCIGVFFYFLFCVSAIKLLYGKRLIAGRIKYNQSFE